ncbi:MAG: hypothetical protein QOD86_1679 [Miltoncostaeaceae bacterium]|jgi:hypothetical protein|nr:hypothetical protein [Miltoncostaeaceae bacterium]
MAVTERRPRIRGAMKTTVPFATAALALAALAALATSGAAQQTPTDAMVTVCVPPSAVAVVGRREFRLFTPGTCYRPPVPAAGRSCTAIRPRSA